MQDSDFASVQSYTTRCKITKMKVADALTTVLISAGIILSSSIAEGNPWHDGEGFSTILKNECGKHGGPKAYDVFVEKFEYASSCVQSLVNVTQLQSEIAYTQSQENLDPVVEEYCRKNETFHECVEHVIEPLKSCVRPEERENINNVRSVTKLFVNFFCKNDGQRPDNSIIEDGLKCLASQQRALETCAEKAIRNYIRSPNATYSAMNEESCSEVEKFRNCVVKASGGYVDETSIPTWIMDALFEHLLKEAECKQPVEEEEWTNTKKTHIDELQYRNRPIPHFWEYKCARNGGPSAYDSFVLGDRNFSSCVLFTLNGLNFEVGDPPIELSSIEPWAKTYCNDRVSLHQKCEEELAESIKPCLDPKERETVDIFYRLGIAMREFACRKDGDVLAELIQTAVTPCFQSKTKALKSCFQQLVITYILMEPGSVPHRFIMDTQDCSNMAKFQHCVSEVLEECETKIFDSLLSFMIKQTPCQGKDD